MIPLVDETVDLSNPFPGLRPFDEGEEHLFFGREGQSDELVLRLSKTKFLAVVGSSGSGKSSLVRCGLLPSLHGGYMSSAGSAWRVAVFRPGDDPIGSLAQALAQPDVLGDDVASTGMHRSIIESTLRRSDRGVIDAFEQAHLPKYENLLILADQFEELFRFSQLEKKQGQSLRDSSTFVNLLLTAAREKGVKIYVVLTMRSDFLGHCTEFRGLPEAINDGQYLIPRMNREERRSAIMGPIAVGGASISQRLVTKLLNDVGDNPDQLPILQHALMRTWEYWSKHQHTDEDLDLSHYNAIGTMSSALSQHAEEAYAEIKGDEKRQATKFIFQALTDKSSHTSGIRRPTRLDEIVELANCPKEEVIEILDVFRKPGRSFIMPPAGVEINEQSVIDISHESFMRVWERLIVWVDEEALAAETYKRLAEAARLYQLGKSGIWRDPELSIALRWQQETNPNSTWAKRYNPTFERAVAFLDYSKEQARLEVEQKERQQKQRILWAKIVALVLGAAALVVTGLAIVAFQNEQMAITNQQIAIENECEAIEQKKKAEKEEAKAKKAEAKAILEQEKAEEEKIKARKSEAEAKLSRAEAIANELEALREKTKAERHEKTADSSKVVAHNLMLKTDTLRQRAEDSEAQALKKRKAAEARNMAFQTKKLLIDDDFDGALKMINDAYKLNNEAHDKENGADIQNNDIYQALDQVYKHKKGRELIYRGHKYPVRSITSPTEDEYFATGDDTGNVHIIKIIDNVLKGKKLGNVGGSSIRSLYWIKDDSRILVGTFSQSLHLIDTSSNKIIHRIDINTRPLLVAPIGDEGEFVVVGHNRLVRVLVNENKITELGYTDMTGVTAAQMDGNVLITAEKEQLKLFRIPLNNISTSGQDAFGTPREFPISKSKGRIVSLVFDESNDVLLLGSAEGRIYRGNTTAFAVDAHFIEHKSGITAIHQSNSGTHKMIVSSSHDKTGMVFPIDYFYSNNNDTTSTENEAALEERIELLGHDKWVMGCQVSNSGKHLVTIGEDKKVRLWFLRMDDLATEVSEL